ncbi:uncharacterized protein TNCV_3685111 [Trichonephila clavipes]|uniref:Paired domain-containing protein n=1 Tax=Trichonephila clavipes TaxID=2585209 RepID=A0A8X6V705_TRICX|nr:uncharacterized protein TNCV_3685111 [Trichonephila clavipes]
MPICTTEIVEMVDLSMSMIQSVNSDSNADIDNETPIKIVTFSNVLHCFETVETYLMQQHVKDAVFSSLREFGKSSDETITHILKKNRKITGNHQMARRVRHNDESVREGYIRNSDKEVKFFTSALKAFQCNNRIVMAQRKHLDDFLRGRIIERLECGRTHMEVSEELGIAQSVISRLWQRFQDDGNVSRCYSTEVAPELQRRMRTGIFGSYCQKKQTEHSIRPVSSSVFSYRYDSFKADRVQTLRAHWSICS